MSQNNLHSEGVYFARTDDSGRHYVSVWLKGILCNTHFGVPTYDESCEIAASMNGDQQEVGLGTKLFLADRVTQHVEYDEYMDMVIAAHNEEHAQELLVQFLKGDDEFDPDFPEQEHEHLRYLHQYVIKPLVNRPPGIIVAEFRAG